MILVCEWCGVYLFAQFCICHVIARSMKNLKMPSAGMLLYRTIVKSTFVWVQFGSVANVSGVLNTYELEAARDIKSRDYLSTTKLSCIVWRIAMFGEFAKQPGCVYALVSIFGSVYLGVCMYNMRCNICNKVTTSLMTGSTKMSVLLLRLSC